MSKIRKCDSRCHNARGRRCRCWCGGSLHEAAGAVNREALKEAVDQQLMLEQHGFKEGKTAYIEQPELPIEVG